MIFLKRTVKKFLKSVKYNVTFKNAETYLTTLGYSIAFFGTPSGDSEIEKHGLQYMTDEKAFTYCGQSKLVFISASLHANDKLLVLLHEIGHILFGHLGKNKHLTRDDVKAEIEADAFAYSVLNHKKPLLKPLFIAACAIVILGLTLFLAHNKTEVPQNNPAENINETAETFFHDESIERPSSDEIVYITKTGNKFHRSTCSSLHSSSIPLQRDEAEANYTPCKICNP